MTNSFQFPPHHDTDKDTEKRPFGTPSHENPGQTGSNKPFAPQSQKSAFGTHTFGQHPQNPTQPTTPPRFGSTGSNTSAAFGSTARPAFGTQGASQGTQARPAFGSSTGSGAFGANTTTPKPASGSPAGSGVFGTPAASKPAFGSSSTTGAFGGAAANKPAFGSSTGSGTFGTPSTAPRPAFGSQQHPSFGSAASQSNTLPQSPRPSFRPASSSATPPFQPRSSLHRPTSLRKDGSSGLTDEEFLLLRDFIYKQCGIFIAENRKYLVENRLSARIKELNLKNYSEYYKYLKFDVNKDAELNKLFVLVTTNETSFFRNPPQLQIFQDIVLTNLLKDLRAANQRKLRIWSAGCSTGEEPYTLAIIIADLLQSELSAWDIKITANDLSTQVLQAAREGIYNEYTLRTTPKEFISRYFTQDGKVYKIKNELKRMVSFGQINLSNRDQLKLVERSHIVFCRNVIIYFDDDMKRKVINAFYDNLLPGGALLIGHSETLHNICRSFELEHYTGAIVYRKK